MLRPILAGMTALAIAGSTLAFAQPGGPDGKRRGPTVEDMRAFADARIAGLRAGLALNAEQEKHWPAFETAVREMQSLRINRFGEMRKGRGGKGGHAMVDPAERMRLRANRLTETGAAMQKVADALAPLYQSLDDSQKQRFAVLSRMTGPRGQHHPRRFHRGGGDGGGHHYWQHHHRTDVMPGAINPSLLPATEHATGPGTPATTARAFNSRKGTSAPAESGVRSMSPTDGATGRGFRAKTEL